MGRRNRRGQNNNDPSNPSSSGPRGLIGAALNSKTSEDRHAVMENFASGRFGKALSWIPFVMLMAVLPTNNIAAAWTSFACSLALNLTDFYRSRYNPNVFFPDILHLASLTAFTIAVILVYQVFNVTGGGGGWPAVTNTTANGTKTTTDGSYNYKYIGAIVVSTIAFFAFASVILCYPFTYQASAPKVDEATRKSPAFHKMNMILSSFWCFIFATMVIFVWCALVFPTNSAGQIALGTVMPIVMPIFGFLGTMLLVKYFKSKAPQPPAAEPAGAEETVPEAVLVDNSKPQDRITTV